MKSIVIHLKIKTDRNESNVGVYLNFVSGVPPSKVSYTFELINKMEKPDLEIYYEVCVDSEHKWFCLDTSDAMGIGKKFISHKDLLENSKSFFIIGRKIRIVTTIFVEDVKPVANVPSRFLQNLKNLYDTKDHADLIIKGSGTGKIKAHKTVLVASSEVFNRMLTHDMDEKESGIIHIKDLSLNVIEGLLYYIYCEDRYGEIPKLDEIDINLYHAAEKYQFDELKILCLKSIYARLEYGNALEVLTFAKLFNLRTLHSCCLLLIYV